MINENDYDDVPQLSAESLAALNEFYSEQREKIEAETFNEDWELSQFWYDEETTTFLAETVIKSINGKGVVGCISCPTLYIKLLKLLKDDPTKYDFQVYLLEYDQRFASLGPNFVYYDYRTPLAVRDALPESIFDIIVCDPPFLSEECLTKVAQTLKYLAKDKIILNTGAVLSELVDNLIGLKASSTFFPRHKNNLANQFNCFSNFSL
ncbi:EEF1A lysine methyltransferase 1 [Tetranychus urticae]|uniref:Protein-lysine N-methyltransferase 107371035 n=1 Tax=Tetranychus urticae TaxID=32264 RepID=T1JVT7_TETUR|nr:EEF1A lysine methyltransferase 1 [Tetranychus urticae]